MAEKFEDFGAHNGKLDLMPTKNPGESDEDFQARLNAWFERQLKELSQG
jgi:hypothetical protein